MCQANYIAVIDDDPGITRMLRVVIEQLLGIPAREFNDSEAALAALKAGMHDVLLVICDLRMPKLDGLALARRLREVDPGCPIMLVTAYYSDDMAKEAKKIGVSRIVPKPFAVGGIVEAVRTLVDLRKSHSAQSRANG